jgi:hypothetical protein
MRVLIRSSLILIGAAALAGTAAGGEQLPAPPEVASERVPPKDCTPVNSRYGYYGNIWCTAAEQRAWELWSERRRTSSADN